MDFGILGPVAAWHAGETVTVGGPRQRCILGALLVELGKEVPIERLIDYLWNDEPPRTARSVIQVQVSHLRRRFPHLIRTTSGGYSAMADPERVDLHRFRRLVVEAQSETESATAAALWNTALSCWRGNPLSGTGSDHLWYAVRQPLLEERWNAVIAWAECHFALGRYSEVIARLTPAVREDPLRERPQYLLMAALYYGGQRSTALSVFNEMRAALAEELGIGPGHEVLELYERILHDTDGQAGGRPAPPPVSEEPGAATQGSAFVHRNDLPRDTRDFTGRDAPLEKLLSSTTDADRAAEVSVITGPGGSGKTAIAVHAAHRLVDAYPDAQLFIDLQGHTPDQETMTASSALGTLLRGVGVSPDAVPEPPLERAAMWRATLAGRRILIVLDNAESSAQVRPLLPASPGSLTLITTRHDLSGLGGRHYVSLDMLSPHTSVAFFATVLGTQRVKDEPDTAYRVAELCGGLPLALRIVAARLLSRPRWTFAHLERRLSHQNRRFDELRSGGQSVEAVFEVSYRSLNTAQRRAFLLLGAMLGTSIDLYGAAALLGWDLERTDDMLQELVSVCLLDEQRVDLYRFHDLTGVYARQRALADLFSEEIDEARSRLTGYYLHAAREAAEWLGPRAHEYQADTTGLPAHLETRSSRSEAVSWLDTHRNNLSATVEYAAGLGWGRQAWQLAHSLWRFYALRGDTDLWLLTHEQALSVSRASSDDTGSAVTLVGLGIAHCMSGRLDTSLALLKEARSIFAALGDRSGEARALGNLAMVFERMGRFHDAIGALSAMTDYASDAEDQGQALLRRANLAVLYSSIGDIPQALSHCRSILENGPEERFNTSRALAMRTLGELNTRMGDYAQARELLEQALSLFQALGEPRAEVFAHKAIGVLLRHLGEYEAALRCHRLALELGERTMRRSAEAEVRIEMGHAYADSGRTAEAEGSYTEALRLARGRYERYTEAHSLLGLARLNGSPGQTRSLFGAAAEILAELDVPEAAAVKAELAEGAEGAEGAEAPFE